MKTYKHTQDGFREIKKRTMRITVPFVALALLLGFGISYYNAGGGDFTTLPLVVLIGLGAGGFGILKGLNRQRDLFNSYTLTMDESSLQREQLNTATLRISKADVKEIVRCPNGSILIKGREQTDTIIVSANIEDYDNFMAALREWGEVRNHEAKPLQQGLLLSLIVGGMALIATVYISTNKYLVLVSGTALLSGLVWSVYQVQTSKNVDRKTKRSLWWTVLVMLSVLGIMYAKLTA